MTSAANGTKPPSPGASAVIAISVVLAMGLGGLAFYLRHGALRAESELSRSKEEFEKMVRMKRQIEELKKNAPRLPAAEKGGEDLLQLLASKARQANIPQNMLTASRNPDRKEGGWKEITYTVNLRATSKDNLVLRSSVVDFLALVERERPSVKAKNLALVFSGNDFTSATITFSLFQRESS
jgi:uncharacterized protein HemX